MVRPRIASCNPQLAEAPVPALVPGVRNPQAASADPDPSLQDTLFVGMDIDTIMELTALLGTFCGILAVMPPSALRSSVTLLVCGKVLRFHHVSVFITAFVCYLSLFIMGQETPLHHQHKRPHQHSANLTRAVRRPSLGSSGTSSCLKPGRRSFSTPRGGAAKLPRTLL